MAVNPALVVRVAANLAELKRNLAEGKGQIETTTAAMAKLAGSLDGSKLEQRAHNIVAAVHQIGGATKLSEQEQARLNRTLTEYIDKADRMGKVVPQAMRDLAAATTQAEKPTASLSAEIGTLVTRYLPMLTAAGAIAGLTKLASAAFESAGHIKDLAGKTGLSIETIQRMQAVANQTGTSVDTFSSAVFRLGVSVAEGTTKARGAVQALGLSFDTIRALKPEDQFARIVAALGRVQDTQERNRIGVALFGKQFAEIAAAIAEGYSDIADAATVATDEQIDALDRAGDAWQKFKDDVTTATTSVLGEMVRTVSGLADALQRIGSMDLGTFEALSRIFAANALSGKGPIDLLVGFGQAFAGVGDEAAKAEAVIKAAIAGMRASAQQSGEAARDAGQGFVDYSSRVLEAVQEIAKLTPLQRDQIAQAKRLGVSQEEIAAKFTLSADAVKLLGESHEKAAKATARTAREMGIIFGQLTAQTRLIIDYNVGWTDYVTNQVRAAGATDDLTAMVIAQAHGIQTSTETINFGILASRDYTKSWVQLKGAVEQTLPKMEDAAQKARRLKDAHDQATTGLRNLAQGFANLAQIAGDGGLGTVLRTLAQIVGAMALARDATDQFKQGLDNLKPGSRAAGFTQMAAGVIAFVGALQQATNTTSRLQGALGGFLTGAATGNLFITIAATVYGFARAQQNAAHQAYLLKVAQQNLKVALVEQLAALGDARFAWRALNDEFEQLMLQPSSDDNLKRMAKILEEIQKRISDTNRDFGELAQEMIDAGYRIPAALQPVLQQLVDLGVLSRENARLFATLTDGATVDWRKMQEAAQRYGIDVDSLGKSFHQLRLGDAAKQIINDFDLMVRGGADVGAVLFGMKDEIVKLIQDSIKFGTTIPENMRPWIEELERAGLLVDENGEKLWDLGSLKFGKPIETEFERITKAIEKLIETLDLLAASIKGLPSPDVKVPSGTVPEPGTPFTPDYPTDPRERGPSSSSGAFSLGHSAVQQVTAGASVVHVEPRVLVINGVGLTSQELEDAIEGAFPRLTTHGRVRKVITQIADNRAQLAMGAYGR